MITRDEWLNIQDELGGVGTLEDVRGGYRLHFSAGNVIYPSAVAEWELWAENRGLGIYLAHSDLYPWSIRWVLTDPSLNMAPA